MNFRPGTQVKSNSFIGCQVAERKENYIALIEIDFFGSRAMSDDREAVIGYRSSLDGGFGVKD